MSSVAAISSRLGVVAQFTLEIAAGRRDLVQLLDHVDGKADDATLLRDAAGDGLPHPPGGIRRELEALGVVELLDGADQAGVALLHEVEHRHLRPGVLARDRDDEAQVRLDELLLRALAFLGDPPQLFLGGALGRSALGAADPAGLEEVLGEQASLDGLAQLDFAGSIEQGRPGDLGQVHADAVFALDAVRAAWWRSWLRPYAAPPRCEFVCKMCNEQTCRKIPKLVSRDFHLRRVVMFLRPTSMIQASSHARSRHDA